jgi:hypothetical protein
MRRVWVFIGLACVPFVMGSGCQQPVDSVDDLSVIEKGAVKLAAALPTEFLQAVGLVETALGAGAAVNAKSIAPLEAAACPVVNQTDTSVSVDFDGGCAVPMIPEISCSGSASGTVDKTSHTVNLNIQSISCASSAALSGNVSGDYTDSSVLVGVNGQWNLSYLYSGQTALTTGTGEAQYTFADKVAQVVQFSGKLNIGTEWNVTITGVKVGYQTYHSLIPYSGTITLSGLGIREETITFDTNSPSTHMVTVSVNGGPAFTADLDSL